MKGGIPDREGNAGPVAPSTGPLELLCAAMIVVGVALALDDFSGFFGQWRARGAEAFGGGYVDPSLEPALDTFEGIVGGTLVGKWSAAWALVRFGPIRTERWVGHALGVGLVVLGGFEAVVLVFSGVPAEAAAPEALSSLIALVLILRVMPPAGAAASAPKPRPPLAKGAFEFAAANVVLGLALVPVVQADFFAIYRDGMADAWYGGRELPSDLLRWLPYAYGTIGAGFAAHFAMLAFMVRHAFPGRWAIRTYAGSVLAWFTVDSLACLLHGAAFNVWLVNVPAVAGTALVLWLARRNAPAGTQKT